MAKVLIIDDEPTVNDLMAGIARRMSYDVSSAFTLQDGLQASQTADFDVIFLDVFLPDGNGIDALPQIKNAPSAPEVIIMTGFGDPDGAELAIKNGAWDYVLKPYSVENVQLTLKRAFAFRQEKLSARHPVVLNRDDIIGGSAQIRDTLAHIARAAATKANVLISGETGTGKELFARAIHQNSILSNRRFVVVDCASLPETLVENTLFGHKKGAFTGADQERDGLIKQADGGTLFLDEIGELPLAAQKAFLRVIQERQFRPLSSKQVIEVDFRLVAATNRDLDQLVVKGLFRSDLLYRLRSLHIETPPLRVRPEDIKELTIFYMNKLCELYNTDTKGFAPGFFEALNLYKWPGNVRELFNTLEEVLSVVGSEPTLYPHHLPTHIRAQVIRDTVQASVGTPNESVATPLDALNQGHFFEFRSFREDMERQYLRKLLHFTQGNKKEACRISGISRTRLFELLRKYDISKSLRQKHG